MLCKNISMDEVEDHIQQSLYQMVGFQAERNKINTDIRRKVCEEEEKEIESYKKGLVPPGLKWINTYIAPAVGVIGAVSAGLGIVSAMLGDPEVAILFGVITGATMIFDGTLQIMTGAFQEKTAISNGLVKQSTALEGYLSDRNSNIDTKTKNAYQTMSSLAKVFNKLIATHGDAVRKVIRK